MRKAAAPPREPGTFAPRGPYARPHDGAPPRPSASSPAPPPPPRGASADRLGLERRRRLRESKIPQRDRAPRLPRDATWGPGPPRRSEVKSKHQFTALTHGVRHYLLGRGRQARN